MKAIIKFIPDTYPIDGKKLDAAFKILLSYSLFIWYNLQSIVLSTSL